MLPARTVRRTVRPRPGQPAPAAPSHAPDAEHGTGAGMPRYLQRPPEGAAADPWAESSFPDPATQAPDAPLATTGPSSGSAPSSTSPHAESSSDSYADEGGDAMMSVDPGTSAAPHAPGGPGAARSMDGGAPVARDEDAAQAEADPQGGRRRRPPARRRGPGQAAGGAGQELAFDLGTLEMPDFSAVVAEQPRHAAYIEHHQVLSADLMQRMDASAFARLDRAAPGTGTSAAGSPAADSVEEAATEVLESAGEDQSSEEARPGGDQPGVQAAVAEPMAVDWHQPEPRVAPAPRVEGRPGEHVRAPEVVRAAQPAPSTLAPRESAPAPATPAAPEANAQAQSAADESLAAVDETGAEVSTEPAAGEAAAGAGDPAEGAEAAVQGAAQAEAQAGEGGAGPPRPRGGGGAPGLGAWRAQVTAATTAIPQPDAGDPAAATAPIAQTGQAAAAAHQAEAAAIPGEGQQQLPPQQGEVPATPPDPGPVPEAGRLVDEAAARTLDPQTPPAFEASPQGFMPVMGQNPITPDQLRRLIDTPPLYVSDPSDPERTRLEEMRLALLEPQLTPEQATGQPTPVGSATPPPAPAIPPETAVDIGRVIANLLADPSGEARQMLGRVRQGYAGGALQQEFPTLGDEDLAPELAVELERQLRGIATEAGVAAEDLETAVANRRSVLEERRRVAEAEVSSTTQLYSEQVQAAGQQEMSTVAGTRRQLDAAADRAEAAAGAADPAAIRTQRDRLLDDVTTRVAAASTQFRQAGERRQTELDQAASGQTAAYRRAAQQDELKIRSDTSSGRASTATEDLVAASRAWSTRKIEESGTAIRGLKTAATTRVEQLQNGLETAADGARERIRAWADEQTGERRSWWDQLMDWIGDWTRQARANAQAWERVRNERAARTIASDLQQVQRLAAAAQSGVDAATATGGRRLSEEQQAIVDSLFGTGADRGDPIAAVAAGTRARILGERRGELTRQLEDRLMRPDVDAVALERVAKGINPSFDAAHIASECHLAMHGGVTGWGTDEAQIFRALAGLSRLEGVAVRRMYAQDYDGASLDADLADELSGDEARRAAAQLEGDQTRATVAELHEAMAGLGTDEATIMAALRNKSPEEREQIERLYREQYGVDLRADLRDEMSGLELDRGLALADGDLARADAIELQDAMAGAGTNEEAIEGVYSRIRDEVRRQADREGWTTAQMEAEIRRRAGQVESTFNTRFGAEYGAGEGSALRRAFGEEMEGPQLELANAVADNDLTRADAARLAVERDSFVTDDEVVNNVLRAQYERALDATRRDEGPRLRAALAEEERRTGPWDPYERRRREREIDRQLEAMAQVQATQNMADLERTYDTQFSRWGTGSMRAMIEFNTSGDERERARDLMAQGGYLSPAQEIDYAVRGAGTDEAAITRALQGRSPAEIEEIRREYRRISGGGDMDARLASELDGRDWLDTRIALRGEPESAEEEMAQMRERVAFERANTSTLFGSGEAARMERRVTRLETAYNQAHDPTVTDPQERIRRLQRFQQAAGHVRVSADEVRHQSEAVADTLATTAGIVAAVVVIVAASIVTGGAAAAGAIPALMATLGSGGVAAASAAASVAATIITRRALLGEAYGGEQIGIDIAVGVVDAVASYATAGLGAGLLKVVEGAPVGTLARMATSGSRVTRMVAHGLAEGAEGFVSTLPSALAGNVLNDDNWRHGNPALNILTGTAFETGIGTFVSGAMGSAGGWTRQLDANVPPVRETGDVLAHRGTPAERMASYRAFAADHPEVPYQEWVRAFDAGVVTRQADEAAERAMQRQLRTELLAGIPAADRRQFADAVVEVMDDAEFARRFGSVRGQAVTLIEDGRPRVVMRESADPRVLREEGIHMLQSVDPRTRAAVSRLDEARLADWDRMDLGEQLSLYRTKMELEVDAQERMIRSLDDEIARVDDAAARQALRSQRDAAEQSLDTLRSRLDEVDSITPDRQLRIAAGAEPRPQYLDQPSRLFNKPPVTHTPPTGGVPVTNSPLSKKKPRPSHVYVVEEFPGKLDGEDRLYRRVVAQYPDGTVRVREEILLISGPNKGGWVQRGSWGNEAGQMMEEASRAMTRAEVPLVPLGGRPRHVPANVQNESGQGFDEVIFKFDHDADGNLRARVTVVEVKNYPDRHVPLEDFTAVSRNMDQNLDDLFSRVIDDPGALGLSEDQAMAVMKALADSEIDVEIRLGPGTRLGTRETGSVITDLETMLRGVYGDSVNVPDWRRIPESYVNDATLARAIANDPTKLDAAGRRVLQLVDADPTATEVRHARAALLAESTPGLHPPVRLDPSSGDLVDRLGNPIQVFSPSSSALDVEELTWKIFDAATTTTPRPTFVVLDTSDLTPEALAVLRARIDDIFWQLWQQDAWRRVAQVKVHP